MAVGDSYGRITLDNGMVVDVANLISQSLPPPTTWVDNNTTTWETIPHDWGKWADPPHTSETDGEKLHHLLAQLSQCVVCGNEGFVLCDICVEAVKSARKDLYQGMLLDMMEMERKDEMRLHQAVTGTGGLVHAVVLIERGKYMKRALCGVKVTETTARYFDKADKQCQRCKKSMEKQSA